MIDSIEDLGHTYWRRNLAVGGFSRDILPYCYRCYLFFITQKTTYLCLLLLNFLCDKYVPAKYKYTHLLVLHSTH